MGKVIDTDVLKKILKTDCSWELFDDWGNYKPEGNAIMNAIDRCQSAESRKKGKWIDDIFCSECGWTHEIESGFIGSVKQFNFCPNCGADMRGEEE